MTLLRAFLSVSGLTFLSRAAGLCRDVVIAQVFGAGALTDAFFAAFRLPNTLRRFTAEGALTQAFVPVYSERRRQNAQDAALLAGEIALLLTAFLGVVTLAGVAFAPQVIGALAPGLAEEEAAAEMFRVLFPYILFISLVALFAGMLNATGAFTAAAAAPLLLNAAMIASAWWWAPLFARPINALAWGVFAGGAAQLAWMAWHVRRAGLRPALRRGWRRPSGEAVRVLQLLWRGAVGAGAAQINLLINLVIASFLTAGSISWLYYADRLMELPAGMLGAALATVALPKLAGRAHDAAAFNALLDSTLRLMLFLALPAAAGLALLALPLTATLFMHGAFSAEDARMTARAVLAYSAGVVGLVAVRPLAAAFFARQDASAPVRAALCALAATQIFNLIFVFLLQFGHAGLALSVGLASCVNAGILLVVLRRRGWYKPAAGWLVFFARTFAALAAMCGVLFFITPAAEYWLAAGAGARVAALAGCLIAAVLTYFAAAYMLGARPAHFRRH